VKVIAFLALLVAAAGCSGPCHDLIEHKSVFGVPTADNYYACSKGCCKQAPKSPRDCSCSDRCPCWARHTELTKVVIPADQAGK
jgi:hypothetical protein